MELSIKADFITWGKYIRDEELCCIPDDKFTCQRINKLGVMTQGRLHLRLHFAIAHRPLVGV